MPTAWLFYDYIKFSPTEPLRSLEIEAVTLDEAYTLDLRYNL